MTRLSLGIGLSSRATRAEVDALTHLVLGEAGVDLAAVTVVATREALAADPRLRLGPPVVAVDDATLLADHPATGGTAAARHFPARVAEGCALTAAGRGAVLVVSTRRSAHATAALAVEREDRRDAGAAGPAS